MIFVDTSALLSRYLAKDQYHYRSLELWNKICLTKQKCVISNFVLNETITLLARRAGYSFAAEKAYSIFSSKVITILRPDENDELNAVFLLKKYEDQKISFTDCISFVLLKKYKVKNVFSFDSHFKISGFNVLS